MELHSVSPHGRPPLRTPPTVERIQTAAEPSSDGVKLHPTHTPQHVSWNACWHFGEMAWVGRPLIGAPGLPTRFVREGAWTNAHVPLAELVCPTRPIVRSSPSVIAATRTRDDNEGL